MKFAQFFCLAPHFSEDDNSAVDDQPQLSARNRRRRKLLAGSFFARHSRPHEIGFSVSDLSLGRSERIPSQRTIFASGTISAPTSSRKLVSDDDRRLDETIFESSWRTTSKGSSCSSSSSSSSSSSPSSSFTIFQSPEPKETAAVADKRWALCFLTVSFILMVFCGRICAILWTAAGLLFLPRRKLPPGKPELRGSDTLAVAATPPLPELRRNVSCEYDKRRVVLEGFLGRTKRTKEVNL